MKKNNRSVRNVRRPSFSQTYEAPKKQLRWRKYLRPAMYGLLFAGALYLIFGLHIFDVRTISTVGNQTLTTAELDRQTREIMKSSLIGNNWLFVNTKSIASALKNQNYQLGAVVVKKRLPTNLVIQVDERQPSLTWKSADKVYVLSEEGRAFTVVSGENKKLPLIVDQTNLPVELGAQIVPKSFISFSNNIFAGLKKAGVGIEQASVAESTSELYVKTVKGYTIKFDTERPAEDQLADLTSLLSTLSKQKKQVSESIDLRIPQNVFYK